MDYQAYLDSLNETQEIIDGMFSMAEREVEWTLSDHKTDVALSIRSKIYAGLREAQVAIECQKAICQENL